MKVAKLVVGPLEPELAKRLLKPAARVDRPDRSTYHRHELIGAELVERCRVLDPETTASTVYRTLDVLEEIGLVRHSHGHDGREEFHVLPSKEHGHLRCEACGNTWEIEADEARRLTTTLVRDRRFHVNLSHLSIVGRCSECSPG